MSGAGRKLLRRIAIGTGVAGFMVCAFAVLLFNRPTLGWQLLSVPTGSMRPTFSPGSLVLVHRVPDATLKVGDVITYTNPMTMRTTLTHRIIKVYKINGRIPAFITKGDANPTPDLPVVGGLVQGRMVGHVPFVGKALMWAKTWVGITLLVYLPALIIMIQETRRLAAYLKTVRPYRLPGFKHRPVEASVWPKLTAAASTAALSLVFMTLGWHGVSALSGGSVVLTANQLSVVAATKPPRNTCSNSNNVHVQNSSNQTGSSGAVSLSGNTAGGSATSGSVTNTNSTNVTVTAGGGC